MRCFRGPALQAGQSHDKHVNQASIRECTSREPQRRSFEALSRALTYTGVVPVRPAIASALHATRTAIAIRSKTQICRSSRRKHQRVMVASRMG